ncbi:MAG: fimbrillin family protein [Alistipes sp.]|nr:fimbrillin family protein [Alistipes sp.]
MKKLLFAAAAIVAMASCATDDVVSRPAGAAIEFNDAFVENSTRAADIDAENLTNFGVYGSVVNSSNQQGMIFANQVVTKTASGYTYTPAQYWIAGAKYDFVAFAPYQSGADATWTYAPAVGTAAENGTITFDNAKAGANQDFLFAATSCETPASITTAPAPVAFTFNHMLSRVKLSFTNGFQSNGNIKLVVKNVHITNTAAVGTLSVAKAESATAAAVAADWTTVATNNNLDVTFGDVAAAAQLAEAGSGSTTHFYVIPAEREYNITFDVDLYQAGVHLDTYHRSAKVTVDFTRGMSYDLKATLNQTNTSDEGQLYPIEFTVTGVEKWDNNPDTPEEDWTDVNATVND